MATGTVTVAESRSTEWPLSKVMFTWVSTAGGDAGDVTTYAYTGKVVRLVQIPDAGGTQPTDAYDVTILDGDSVDILAGQGANVSNAGVTQVVTPITLGAVVESKLTLVVSNAGNAKGGKTIVYISKVG